MPPRNEDTEITTMRILAYCALVFGGILLATGTVIVAASATDPTRVAWQGAGYTCTVWAGVMVVAWGALRGHAKILERVQRNHDAVMHELTSILDRLRPHDEMAGRRRESR